MARQFCTVTDCEVFFEGFEDLAGTLAEDFIEQASDWVYAQISEFHPAPSLALPETGVSPNYWVRSATTQYTIYLALDRRMITSQETDDGYWRGFLNEAKEILVSIYEGKHKLDPLPMVGEKGIGMTEAIANGTNPVGTSTWFESNCNVPTSVYEDDTYSRMYYIELESVGSNVQDSTFKWRTDMTTNASGYEATGLSMDYTFIALSYGVEVRFLPESFDEFEVGMTWRIKCFPERDSKQRSSSGMETVFWEMG